MCRERHSGSRPREGRPGTGLVHGSSHCRRADQDDARPRQWDALASTPFREGAHPLTVSWSGCKYNNEGSLVTAPSPPLPSPPLPCPAVSVTLRISMMYRPWLCWHVCFRCTVPTPQRASPKPLENHHWGPPLTTTITQRKLLGGAPLFCPPPGTMSW